MSNPKLKPYVVSIEDFEFNGEDAIRMAVWRSLEQNWKEAKEPLGRYDIWGVDYFNDISSVIQDAKKFLPATKIKVPRDYNYHTKPIPPKIKINVSEDTVFDGQ